MEQPILKGGKSCNEGGKTMFTLNNQNSYTLLHNGPHVVKSTSPKGVSITVRDISFEKTYVDYTKGEVLPSADSQSDGHAYACPGNEILRNC